MRNLLKHPITKAEMLVAIDRACEHFVEENARRMVIGDITAMALIEARRRIEKMEE